MSEQEEKIVLSRSDLYLVMESYRNNIAMNTTLVEQQKQLLILQNDILEKQQNFAETLREIAQNGKDLIKKQEDVLTRTSESAKSFEYCAEDIAKKEEIILEAQKVLDTTLDTVKKDLITAMTLDRYACSADHGSLKNSIKLIVGTFAAITLGLVGLAATIFSKYGTLDRIVLELDKINEILNTILQKISG